MTINDETRAKEATLWRSRIASLEKIACQIEEEKEKQIEPDPKEELRVELQRFDKGWPNDKTDGLELLILLPEFMNVYTRRQRETCRRLIKPMMQFTKDTAGLLDAFENEERYSQRYLWRLLLNEVSTDIGVLQDAIQQRDSENLLSAAQTAALIRADIISEYAIGQAIEGGFLQATPVITYLKESMSYRPVPYADVVLISVPYAASMMGQEKINNSKEPFLSVSRDLMAIPHEVGHHLFWNGQIPGKKRSIYRHLQKRLKRAKIRKWDWRRAWLEEVFADAYGFLVAGPVMALSFQDLLTDNPPLLFGEDSGHHPISALRPYIQTKILKGITDELGHPLYRSAPIQLDKMWQDRLAANFPNEWADTNPLEVSYKLQGIAQSMQGQQIVRALEEIINIVLRTLRGQRPPCANAYWTHGGWKAWTTEPQNDEDLIELYDKLTFEKFSIRSRWLQDPDLVSRAIDPQNRLPDQIHFGWSKKGPEHDRV